MANRNLFHSTSGLAPAATTKNRSGGNTYATTPHYGLAQLAVTSCFNNTFYTKATDQLDMIMDFARKSTPHWVAQVAVYARQHGLMKDAPVALVTHLFTLKDKTYFYRAFPQVCNNIGQIRTFVQMVRSGRFGRKSLGSAGQKAINNVLNSMNPSTIFWQAVGTRPSFVDVLRLAHPRPATAEHDALFGWFLGKNYKVENLPTSVRGFMALKAGEVDTVPRGIPFLRLTSLDMDAHLWRQVSKTMSWNQLRINLNQLNRKGLFADEDFSAFVADKLSSPEAVQQARVLPFQVYNTYAHTEGLPARVRNAVGDAVELAAANAPKMPGRTLVLADCSGSMIMYGVTGARASGKEMTAMQAAAFYAGAILKANPHTTVVKSFDHSLHHPQVNPRDSLTTITQQLYKRGGATDCSVGIKWALQNKEKFNTIVIISDNESWYNNNGFGRAATTAQVFAQYKRFMPKAKMVCIDIVPNGKTIQVPNHRDVLNVGGISDGVFKAVTNWISAPASGNHWENLIGSIEI